MPPIGLRSLPRQAFSVLLVPLPEFYMLELTAKRPFKIRGLRLPELCRMDWRCPGYLLGSMTLVSTQDGSRHPRLWKYQAESPQLALRKLSRSGHIMWVACFSLHAIPKRQRCPVSEQPFRSASLGLKRDWQTYLMAATRLLRSLYVQTMTAENCKVEAHLYYVLRCFFF